MNARVQSCYCWQWKGFFLFSFGTFTVSSRRKKSDLNIWRQECHLEAHVLLFGSLNFVLRELLMCHTLNCENSCLGYELKRTIAISQRLMVACPSTSGQVLPAAAWRWDATGFARSPIAAPKATHVYVAYTVLRTSLGHVSIYLIGTHSAIL